MAKTKIGDVSRQESGRCEVETVLCRGKAVARFKGTRKNDPEFGTCLACLALLRHGGVRLKQV